MWGSPLGCIVMLTLSMLLAPLAADAQPPKKVPRIGVLHTNASAPWFPPLLAAFHQGLRDFGYVDGQNLVIEYRSAEGHAERLPALAAELVPASGGGDRGAGARPGPRGPTRHQDDPDCDGQPGPGGTRADRQLR